MKNESSLINNSKLLPCDKRLNPFIQRSDSKSGHRNNMNINTINNNPNHNYNCSINLINQPNQRIRPNFHHNQHNYFSYLGYSTAENANKLPHDFPVSTVNVSF